MRRAGGGRRQWIAPVAIFLVYWSLSTHGKFSVTGDEPHYLLVAHSLLSDGDFDLTNNLARDDGRQFGAPGLRRDAHVLETRHGSLHPVHDVGLPVLLLPVYAAATSFSGLVSEHVLQRFRMDRGRFAYSLIGLFLMALTAVAAQLTRAALIRYGVPSRRATVVVFVLWLSPPVLSNSFVVFPEALALLVTAGAIYVASDVSAMPGPMMPVVGFGLGVLPWCHRKYVLYAWMLMLAVAWLRRAAIVTAARRHLWSVGVLFTVPQAALGAWTLYHWGTLAGPLAGSGLPLAWDVFAVGSVGLFLDRENGLLWWAPVYLLLPLGWLVTWRNTWYWLPAAVALFGVSAAHYQWWGGFSPVGRFLVPLVPLFAVVAGFAVREVVLRRACLILLIPQLLISAYGWQRPRALWPRGDGNNRVLAAFIGSAQNVLPSLRSPVVPWTHAFTTTAVVLVINLAAAAAVRRRRAPDRSSG